VGGWGRYEADRRRARWESDKSVWSVVYAGRSYIGGSDAARSLLASGPAGRPLDTALARLACSLRTLENVACKDWEGGAAAPVALPALTAEDVETFMKDPNPDPEEIDSFLADVAEIRVGTEKPALPALPPLPARVVKTEDAEGLAGLEEAAGPWVQAAEEHRARAASFVDAVAASLGEKTHPAADSGELAGSSLLP
jgi:hypothetical protein